MPGAQPDCRNHELGAVSGSACRWAECIGSYRRTSLARGRLLSRESERPGPLTRLLQWTEAVAQSFRRSALATGGGCGVADGSVVIGGRTCAGAVSGPCGRDLVAVELGEVVSGDQ